MDDWQLGRHTVNLRYQCMIPVIGFSCMPEYGESYYEMVDGGTVMSLPAFTYFGNMPSMRHLLTANIPTGKNVTMLRGYSGDLIQTKVRGLKYHSYTHDFMIGFKYYYMKRARKCWKVPVGEGI